METTEVFPTILDFLKVPRPPKIHGESLLPLMSGQKQAIREYAYFGHFKRNWGVLDHEWKFILNFDKGKDIIHPIAECYRKSRCNYYRSWKPLHQYYA